MPTRRHELAMDAPAAGVEGFDRISRTASAALRRTLGRGFDSGPLPARFFPPPHYFHNPLHPPTKLLPNARILPQLQKGKRKTTPRDSLTLEAYVATTLPSRDVGGIISFTTSRLLSQNHLPSRFAFKSIPTHAKCVSRVVVDRRLGRSCSLLPRLCGRGVFG